MNTTLPSYWARSWRQPSVIASAGLALLFMVLALVQASSARYPYLKLNVPGGTPDGRGSVVLTFLFEKQATPERCQRTLNNFTSPVAAACPQCTVAARECIANLTPEQALLLSERPLPGYSSRLSNGITLYESEELTQAKAACEESEKHSAATGVPVKCHVPRTARPAITSAHSATDWLSPQLGRWPWWGMASLALIALVAQLARPLLPSLGASALTLPRRGKQAVLALADVASVSVALWAAFAIRLETTDVPVPSLLPLVALAPILALPVFAGLGLYRAVIRYIGLHAIVTIVKAVVIYALMLAVAIHVLAIPDVPKSLPLIHAGLVMLLIGGSRALARYWLSNPNGTAATEGYRKHVVIYGAGSAGVQLASALAHSREFTPIAMVDDDPALHRKRIGALEVFPPDELRYLVTRHKISEVLLAIPSAPRTRRNKIISGLEPLPVLVRTLPGVAELAQGKIKTSDLRDIEIEDVLGRDTVAPNLELMAANIAGKAILVTGAGGSIGSELCRQILGQRPSDLVLYELNEFALYRIEQDLIALSRALPHCSTRIWPILGSVCDQIRLTRVIQQFNIRTIYHAAAYKHVPMVEKNPCQGAINNIFGTWHAARAAISCAVETFVLISTDKAVRPTNTMGTTKRFAEMILQCLQEEPPRTTRFVMVRFGNVLGSSGSVVPLFRQQIQDGGPITVTDPRIVRFFMTIPEAAQLVIQAGAMGEGGDIFILDMGEPVKILDLAARMVHLSGLTVRDEGNPDGDIEIVFSGLRPGEKLYEELLIGDNVTPTSHPRIHRANEHTLGIEELRQLLDDIEAACADNDSDLLRQLLVQAVMEFAPQCGNEDLLITSPTSR